MMNGKKKNGSQNDAPSLGTGDSIGSRMSTRSQNNSSPNLRKSNRLEGRPPSTPPLKKKTENPSPLRKSGKDKGSPSSKSSKEQNNGKGESKQDQTLKEIAKEAKGQSKQSSSSEVGSKKVKKRLDARRYKEMFKPLKKMKTSEPESDKKRRLEYSGTSGDSDPENDEVGQDKHNDGDELMSNGTDTEFDNAGGSNSVVNDNTCTDKSCELENGDNNLPSPSPGKESVENTDKTEEVPEIDASIEKIPNGEEVSALESRNEGTDIENEGTDMHSMDAHFAPSTSKTDIFSDYCAKCFRKRSLECDSPEQELCCCLSNTMNDVDNSEDRGQCGTGTSEFADVRGFLCGACQRSGKLLHCCGKGCKRSYHPICSSNPEKDIYLPNWYCSECTKKRFVFGAHSVSRGIESVLEVRDVKLSTEGRPKQKQCFVKYKGLAHIHNRWLSEKQLLHEAPELHEKVGKMDEDTRWNSVWALPHRLLLRRSITLDDTDQGMSLDTKSWYEWLVKWCDLDYDQATWESEDLSCFKSPEGQQLIKEYESRHKARTPPLPVNNEMQEKKKGTHVKLGKHLVGGADNYYQNIVNKLREWHHKGQNGVLLDEQDRLMKIIYLVSFLVSSVSRPFLIIAPHASLSSWEAEFMRLGPSINLVVYRGNADARDIIRTVEFFDGGQMVQVLLSTAEIIAEDTEELKGVEWEAVIVDDCQQSCILVHSDDIMNLATGWRLLLVNAQLQDNVSEYNNILSLLEPGPRNSDEEINVLKDKLSSFIISARFIEYWVPVEMSNLQIEQYCYSILSKSSVLQSMSKSDPVGSLREILISLRKCCDHPYIVDMQLQIQLLRAYGLSNDAFVDLGIKGSGKLNLLDKLLVELKSQGLKVLILFQPTGGSGRDTLGNILEDFIRFRFGLDSYEHVESGLIHSKKQNACNLFNTSKERSFLLLEKRACSPSIKLSLVDAVIIFDSDWNPLNDLKALQRITVDSKIEQIKVFRLYCPGTVEEKVLILAKNDVVLDSNLQITTSTSHMLLMWGASRLFSRLNEFHNSDISDYKESIAFESSLSTDVTQEIISLFRNPKLFISTTNISVAQQNGGCYLKNIPLIGEQNSQKDDGFQPHVFWTNLLEGLKPQWKYLSGSSQRNRKRVQYNELLTETQSEEVTKRRKKTDKTKIDISPLETEPRLEENANPNPHKGDGTANAELDDLKNLHNEQRGLFEILKPTLLQLCETLQLKDDEKRIVEQFLEYLVKNYRVIKEPETLLQAFLLSVCWTAIEGLKKNIDHNNSITIVREKLGFACTESETEDIYSKLKPIYSCSGITNQNSTGDLSPGNPENGFEKYRKKVEKSCEKKMEKLKLKHDEELKEFKKSWEGERLKLEHWCKVETAAIRITHATSLVAKDKLRALDNEYAKKREDLERKFTVSLKELEARQQIERDEEQKKKAGYMERFNALVNAKNGMKSNVTDKTTCNNNGQNCNVIDKTMCNNNASNDNDSNKALEKVQEEPCASTREVEEGNNQVNDVVEGSLTCRPSNQEDRTMGSSVKEVVTDTSQALRVESHIEVEELVSNETETNNNLTLESSQSRNPNNEAPNLPSTTETNNYTECNLDESSNRVVPNNGLDNQINENNASIVGPTAPIHVDHSSSGVAFSQQHPQLTIDQMVNTNLVSLGGLSAHSSLPSQLQAPFPSHSRVPASLLDPFQLELERLRSEWAKVLNHHEGTKSQLKSECEKEIEEVVAQIKKKYDKKAEEVEASFTQKKNELEMCQHKVMMNKRLAEAFRSKCTDYKAAPKTPQLVIPSSSGPLESSSRSHYTRLPFPMTGASTTPPITSPHMATPPVQGVGPTTTLTPQSRMARINPGVPPMTGQHQMAPLRSNLATTSTMHLPLQALPQSASSQPWSTPNSRTHQEGSLLRETLLNHLSNMELLSNLTRQNSASFNNQNSGNVPQFQERGPSLETGNMSECEGATNTLPNSSSLPSDHVVCLSDDE